MLTCGKTPESQNPGEWTVPGGLQQLLRRVRSPLLSSNGLNIRERQVSTALVSVQQTLKHLPGSSLLIIPAWLLSAWTQAGNGRWQSSQVAAHKPI